MVTSEAGPFAGCNLEFLSSLRRRVAQLVGSEVPKCSVSDVQDPDCLAGFVHFVEDAIGVFPIAKEKASDLAPRFSRFTSEGAPIGKLFKRRQAVNEFLEPLRPSDRGPLNDPIRSGLRRPWPSQRERLGRPRFSRNSFSNCLSGVTRPASTSASPRLIPSSASSSSTRSSSF